MPPRCGRHTIGVQRPALQPGLPAHSVDVGVDAVGDVGEQLPTGVGHGDHDEDLSQPPDDGRAADPIGFARGDCPSRATVTCSSPHQRIRRARPCRVRRNFAVALDVHPWMWTLRFEFVAPGRQPLMWCLIAFIVTFFVTRTITRYIRATANRSGPRKWWQPHNISGKGGTHIHHAVFGVILVLISGVAMISMATHGGVREFTVAAVFFGIGAALVLDEFALILHLQDVYWSEDGRTSVDAVFVAVAVAGPAGAGVQPAGTLRRRHLARRRFADRPDRGHRPGRAQPGPGGGRATQGANCGPACWGCSSHRFCSSAHPAVPAARTVGPLALSGQARKMRRSMEQERVLPPFVQANLWLQRHRR